MRQVTVASDALQQYETAVAADDRAAVLALVEALLEQGAAPLDILTGLVVSAQREIGRRWQRGEWSVAQEHAATAMAMAATEIVARRIAQVPVRRGHVIVACAEREWHSLPATIIGCALRADGWQTTQLGPATTPQRVSQYVQDLGPEAVAVSCSMLGAVPTTRRLIEAATSAGVPVVVGGAAFGDDGLRATALGATAWAADARSAVEAVDNLPLSVPPVAPLPGAPAQEQAALELNHQRLVDGLRRGWAITSDRRHAGSSAALRAVARDALPQTLHAVSAALLTGDPRPVSQTAAWLADLLAHRGVQSVPAVADLTGALADTLRDYPLSLDLIRRHFATG
ncbi:cobalamin B12-binding domain-containing protein [Mycobacterium servetii]|uniref:B12-binding domain-containing protein n=1 Tax=Mycobacterium servetii TaxID=3237418 RepID=A0ABV4C168_9MYCO